MKSGDIYSSNSCGDFVIIKCDRLTKIAVRFVDTGTEITTRKEKVLSGAVKDKMFPSLSGVGVIGYGVYTSAHRSYTQWSSMIRRCYCDKYHNKKPTYKECEASEEWQNFQNFAAWYDDNHPNDGLTYDIDKDAKVSGNKLYSPETCLFLSHEDNARISGERFSSEFEVISPSGVRHKGFNQTAFAKKYGLQQTCLSALILERQPAHKGWTLAE